MGVWKDFENWRDNIYCGGEKPQERIEAEIGAEYELYDAIYDKVEEIVVCTEENKDTIERSLNDNSNDIWWYRKVEKKIAMTKYGTNFNACPRCGSKNLTTKNKVLGSGVDKYIRCKDCKLEQYGNSWGFVAKRWNTPKEEWLEQFVNILKTEGNLFIGQFMRDVWNDDAAIEKFLSEEVGCKVTIRECRFDTVGCIAEKEKTHETMEDT